MAVPPGFQAERAAGKRRFLEKRRFCAKMYPGSPDPGGPLSPTKHILFLANVKQGWRLAFHLFMP